MRPRPPPQALTVFEIDLPPVSKAKWDKQTSVNLLGHYEHPVPRRQPIPLETAPIPSKTIHFRIDHRIIEAIGAASDNSHPNVLILQLHRTLLEQAFRALLSYLPGFLTCWLQEKVPEWYLPEDLVLKVEKDGWNDEFERERAIYEQLRPLQGITIPRYYGCSDYNGKRALILSNIGGACLATPEGAVLDEKDLRPLLSQALTALSDMGVAHGDTKLDNFHLVTHKGKDKIMIVDLEIVDNSLSEDDLAFTTSCNHDGHLLPKRALNK
ncbi:hypothetical protein FDECE_2219 [Fusarium decemcellulare]|nr:hypothetical protein FDECE_2219 [Fusarium decemcellulare]